MILRQDVGDHGAISIDEREACLIVRLLSDGELMQSFHFSLRIDH